MRRFLKRYGLAVASSMFLMCLALVAYTHMRYVRAEHVYLSHLGTVTFRPHINVLTGLNGYETAASRWLAWQAIATAATLLVAAVMMGLIWHQRTARVRASERASEITTE